MIEFSITGHVITCFTGRVINVFLVGWFQTCNWLLVDFLVIFLSQQTKNFTVYIIIIKYYYIIRCNKPLEHLTQGCK